MKHQHIPIFINVPQQKLRNRNTNKLEKMIYLNFIELTNEPELLHTSQNINKMLTNDKTQFYVFVLNRRIISYMLGEITHLNDGRNVFYVGYIYTAEKYRNIGLSSKLLKQVEFYCKNHNLDGIMLTCDTNNSQVYEFYKKRGFMLDIILRRHTQHDVVYKQLN